MKNTYLTSDDHRIYEKINDVITEVNKIEETNPSTVSEKENYQEKDRLLEILKALFLNGCNRSVGILAKAVGVPVTQVMTLFTEITLASKLEKRTEYAIEADGGGSCKVYIQMGNRCEISFCGDNCTFNQYNVNGKEFDKLNVATKNKAKKLKNKKR